MKMKVDEAKNFSNEKLVSFGFSKDEAKVITSNLIEAELVGRKPHGLNKLAVIKKVLSYKFDTTSKYFDYIELDKNKKIEIVKESSSHLYIDANFRTGYVAIDFALSHVFEKAKEVPVFAVSIKNMGFASGYIGDYARKSIGNDLIYIGFHNSSGGLNYYGSKVDPLGTNPITIGFPSNEDGVIIDTSMAKLNWNDVEKARIENRILSSGVAIDEEGNDTTDPNKVFSVKSIEGHKGTALAYGVELIAGALSGSRVDFSNFGGWGSTFILINPVFFIGIKQFKDLVSNSTQFIKSLGDDVYYPGEKSNKNKRENIKNGYIEISDSLLEQLK